MIPNLGLEKGFSYNFSIWSVSIEVLIYGFFYICTRYIGIKYFAEIITLFICLILHLLAIKSPIIDCLRYFYLGGLGALIFGNLRENNHIKYFSILLVLIMPLLIYIFNMKHYAFTCLIFFSPFLFYNFRFMKFNSKISSYIQNLGNTTYSSYLLHFPIQLIVALSFKILDIKMPTANIIFFITYIIGTLCISYIVYEFFEKKVQDYIRKELAMNN